MTSESATLNWRERRERERHLPRAQAAFRLYVDDDDDACRRRAAEIADLPTVIFKGRTLKEVECIRCRRKRNMPASCLWALIDVKRFVCPWCALRG